MSILKPFRRAACACIAALAMAGIVRADNVFSVSGPNVSYSGGEIDTQSPTPPAPTWFFGTPIITGADDLHFTSDISKTTKPIQFRVTTPGAEQYEDGALSVDMSTTSPAGSISLMSITEKGDYLIQHATAASTAAAVLNILGLEITQVNGNTPVTIDVPFTESFSSTGAAPVTSGPNFILFSGAGPLVTGTWQGTASFNIAGAMSAAGRSGQRVTGLSLLLDDTLTGIAEPNALVSITKKDFVIGTTANPVPEPSSIILGVLGGMGLAAVTYRKKFAKAA